MRSYNYSYRRIDEQIRGARGEYRSVSDERDRTPRYDRQLSNPDINTNNWGLHKKRLEIHGTSKFRGTTFYVGAKGGVYYISSRGTRVY